MLLVVWPVPSSSRARPRSCGRPWGRLLKSIRDDEDAAASLGKNPFAVKLQSLALGAALAGLAGCFYAWQFSFFSPDDFQPLLTFFAWMIVILGGPGRSGRCRSARGSSGSSSRARASSTSRRSRGSPPTTAPTCG